MKEPLPKRKPTRSWDIDYNAQGAYFITICTEDRKRLLSSITEDPFASGAYTTKLYPYGEIARKHLRQLGEFYDNVKIDQYVIMPNHLHILLFVWVDGASRTSPPTSRESETLLTSPLAETSSHVNGASRTSPPTHRPHNRISRFVSTFKRLCNKEYGRDVWQRSFYDHVIRDREDYEKHVKYIWENPDRWHYDELYTAE